MDCEGCINKAAIGTTGNGEHYCERCLLREWDYAYVHIPEAIEGITFGKYLEECRQRMAEAAAKLTVNS